MSIEQLDLHWALGDTGWAWLTWTADDDVVEIRTSYLDHGLLSLMRAAVDLKRGSSATIAQLSGEPSAHFFLFRTAVEQVSVDVVYVPDLYAADRWTGAELRWTGETHVDVVTQAVLSMAQAVWDEHGAAGYQRLWDGKAFPEEELRVLSGEHP
ncbi:hypothetical protein Q0Z83_039210 [Actinoplanes sichuanensis]|uniref:Uncharacterized protein n=1 Tax=Actinoplanes sichuanensis TaxID=512349 RepID=A0ABW4AUG7_9ACTN|nr:hypothetical protein [Actinoplanes sichuanensis]BEL05730.1 hypothetical protein Q0Z83_039210 [Actinoplanes sichuanensis]